jgi:tRNA dimethylallyltransferase
MLFDVKVPTPIAITGPTASGKTAAALALARHFPIEIISVDSALVYRGMNIGTAKPRADELAQVPHHLIDIRAPFESYNAAEFLRDSTRLIREISARGHWPVFVGGTMLYLKTLLQGIDEMPQIDPMWRNQINEEAARLGWPMLHEKLRRLDPITADRLAPHDAQRISRALEVVLCTGQTLSSLQTGRAAHHTGLLRESSIISLEPLDRAWLHQRIASRFDSMLEEGLVHEVRQLMQDPRLLPQSPAMRCVGYRQAWDVIVSQGALPDSNVLLPYALNTPALQLLREAGCAATRQLAKRQLTWLRSMPGRQVVACDRNDASERVVSLAQALHTPPL